MLRLPFVVKIMLVLFVISVSYIGVFIIPKAKASRNLRQAKNTMFQHRSFLVQSNIFFQNIDARVDFGELEQASLALEEFLMGEPELKISMENGTRDKYRALVARTRKVVDGQKALISTLKDFDGRIENILLYPPEIDLDVESTAELKARAQATSEGLTRAQGDLRGSTLNSRLIEPVDKQIEIAKSAFDRLSRSGEGKEMAIGEFENLKVRINLVATEYLAEEEQLHLIAEQENIIVELDLLIQLLSAPQHP